MGYDARDPDINEPLPNQREFDITFDYKPEKIVIRGLWIRLRYANVNVTGENDSINDFRIILNYNLPLL